MVDTSTTAPGMSADMCGEIGIPGYRHEKTRFKNMDWLGSSRDLLVEFSTS